MVRIFLTTTPTVLVIELSHSFQNTVPFMCSEGAKTFTDDHVPAVPLQEMFQGHTGSLAVAGGWAGIDPWGCGHRLLFGAMTAVFKSEASCVNMRPLNRTLCTGLSRVRSNTPEILTHVEPKPRGLRFKAT